MNRTSQIALLQTLLPIRLFSTTTTPPTLTTIPSVLLHWGFTQTQLTQILARSPLLSTSAPSSLHSKLLLLSSLSLPRLDLLHLLTCLPRFLSRDASTLSSLLRLRLAFLRSLLPSDALLFHTLRRNPSLLNYDVARVESSVSLFRSVGVSGPDLATVLMSRPTILSRSTLCQGKLDLIRRSGVPPGAKLYKYVVSIVAASRLETLCEKASNFERFGLAECEVWELFGRSPNVMTFSSERMQRHMAFIMGTMDLPASVVVRFPALLQINLDKVLRPRFLLMCKLEEMGLYGEKESPKFVIHKVVRMTEKRFVKLFISCHEKSVAGDLTRFYEGMKGTKRLAESSRLSTSKGFPF